MADIKINGATPSGFYYGGTAAEAVYYGSTKLWEPAPAGAVIGGKTYPTVTLPDGHEWLAVNLDYAWTGLSVPTSGASASSSPQAMYFNYDEATYGWSGLQRGLLYNHYAVSYLETNKATLCPGWHVPTQAEFDALVTALGANPATKLKSTTGWNSNNGTDDYGFAGYPSGYFTNSSVFSYMSDVLYFWTTTVSSPFAMTDYMWSTNQSVTSGSMSRQHQLSVRLIKDY